MRYWFEVLAGFDNLPGGRRKEPKNQQSMAILALMYLALGEDHPYHFAKEFNLASKDYKKGFSLLKYGGKVATLLNEMEDKGLLLVQPDRAVRERNLFRINPMIIQSPTVQSIKDVSSLNENQDTESAIPLEIIEKFLDWMKECKKTDEKRIAYLSEWSSIKEFDFVTFLIFLQKEAKNWESANQGLISELPNQELVEGKYKLSEHIENYIDMLSEEFKLNVMTKRGMFKSIKHFLDKPIPLHNFQDPRLPKK